MAKRFLEDAAAPGRPAKRLIVTGRRKDKLDELVNAYGAERVVAVPFDISKVDELHTFTADVLAAFGGALDGVVLNAGMQRCVEGWTTLSENEHEQADLACSATILSSFFVADNSISKTRPAWLAN